jgi:hypothetical protein
MAKKETIKIIKDLFAGDINRRIEEVIKVDQTDERIIRDEIDEYVVTKSICDHYTNVLNRYWEMPNRPGDDVGVWVSGFFGSGKSSFAKMLGLALENRKILGEPAAQVFSERAGDRKINVLLQQITEHIPTNAVIFDVSTDRGIRTGNQTLTEIMYRLFLQNLGYAGDLDLAELEITLEQMDKLDEFIKIYGKKFGQDWDKSKDLIALSLGEASTVMHALFPDRYTTDDSWLQALQNRADISPGKLADRCQELMGRRRPKRNLVFVIDEVGQFVARDVQKMLDLQAVVQNLGRVGKGKMWLVITSQEKLTELVGGLEDRRIELARLMDRFPHQVHLEPSDISEVTSKRVLNKNAPAQQMLRTLFQTHSGRLSTHTRLSADIQLPELTAESFIDLYPLLPYQIDLIIQVVSGLRTQGGAGKHVGGANRTIIKLAQQLLIHEAVGLADQPVGRLARIDQIYDLVAGNVASEIRGKISAIASEVPHAYAQPVAKAICLLQFVQSIHRTAENIAAALHPGVDADSVLPEVREALQKLLAAHKVRLSDGQYRIPTPAEDDWESTRATVQPKPGDVNRIHAEMVATLWEPKPSHALLAVKTFKAGLVFNDRSVVDGDIAFHITLAEANQDLERQRNDARTRSQAERKAIFWVATIDDNIDRETSEVHRSREILSRKERGARTRTETELVADEKRRLHTHEGELRRLLRDALMAGSIFFRGNDRSPDETVSTVGQAASRVLGEVLPDVFDRFKEGAAKVSQRDLDVLLTNENLRGLPALFAQLGLIRDQNGQPVFTADIGPLKEVLGRIENRTSYGDTANGRYLEQEFSGEPFGWDLDVVRLFVLCLLRAGEIKATSQGKNIDSALSVEARNAFSANNLFRQMSFQKRQSGTTIKDWIDASSAFQDVFGKQIPELQAGVVAASIRKELGVAEDLLHEMQTLLLRSDLPGEPVLRDAVDQLRAIRAGSDDDSITTFTNSHKALKEAIRRAGELKSALNETRLHDLGRARIALQTLWPQLESDENLPEGLADRHTVLVDLMARETFFRDLPSIDQHARAIEDEHKRRFDEARQARESAYGKAIEILHGTDGWSELNEEQRAHVSSPLHARAAGDVQAKMTIPHLRAETGACPQILRQAIQEMLQLIEGARLVTLDIREIFAGRVETPEQLEAALDTLRQRIGKLIGEGKKVLLQ